MQSTKFFEKVYGLVKKIPRGKVATYGRIADILNEKWELPACRQGRENENSRIDARTVGWALHANRDPKTPCHRVVNKDGRLAPNFAFDGEREQKRRLLLEGVTFKQGKVDLDKHLWG